MTSEEFKNGHFENLAKFKEQEDMFLGSMPNIPGITFTIPHVATIGTEKLKELFEIFEQAGIDPSQTLTSLLEINYISSLSVLGSLKTADYAVRVGKGVIKYSQGDKEELKTVLEEKEKQEEYFEKFNTTIRDFDVRENIRDAIESGIDIPFGLTKEQALKYCTMELDKLNIVQPKKDHKK